MKIKNKVYLYIFPLAILMFLYGCRKKENPSLESYYEETEVDYTIRIVDNDKRIYFAMESDKQDILILNYNNPDFPAKSNVKLSSNEIDTFKEAIKTQISFDSIYNKQYQNNNKYSITFYLTYGVDELEVMYNGMKVKDLPKELKDIILKLKKESPMVENFFTNEI